jgi:uncharacterized damage-inducible protein DinB
MNHPTAFGTEFAKELETEAPATRNCLERIPENLFNWKPHEKSMSMGNLALLVAEIPKWITSTIEASEIDFATYEHADLNTTAGLVAYLDQNLAKAKDLLENTPDEELAKPFHLKNQGQILFTSSKKESISSSINHLVHHRGQLTVYMRLNDIPVPRIYGPSADEQGF